jgi:leucyl aminopeptidase
LRDLDDGGARGAAARAAGADATAGALLRHGATERDPLWRLPLYKPYRRGLDSKVADLNNIWDSPFAGAITAALFLQEFVSAGTPRVHIDMMAWNSTARPGRPEGGEAMALRALYALVAERAGR